MPTGATDHSPSRGDAELFDVKVGRRSPGPPPGAIRPRRSKSCADAVRIDWDAMDEWLEEDEPVYTHPARPLHQGRHPGQLQARPVVVAGQTVADSHRPRILFETGLPPRYYLPLPDLRWTCFDPRPRSHCPYKGTASYWSVVDGAAIREDLVWIYRTPLPESQKIAGHGLLLQREGGL